jgi:hypothetical protein
MKPERLWDYPEAKEGLLQLDKYAENNLIAVHAIVVWGVSEYPLLIFIPFVIKNQGWVLPTALIRNLSLSQKPSISTHFLPL